MTVLSEHAVFDSAIGVTTRSTHDNTTWQKAQFESCAHRFVSISETDWGAALMSPDKYGYSAKGNVLTISLVRGPMYPDMLADEGHHHFRYAILPHDGRWWSQEVQSEADMLAEPLRHVNCTTNEAFEFAPIAWQGPDLRLHALKPAEDGNGCILRISEAAGRRGAVKFDLPQSRRLTPVDALERPLASGDITGLRPFELRSFRL